jgi:hypothetical protein
MNPPLSRSTHVEEIERLEARVAELEEEDRVKTNADEACAHAAEAKIARLEARIAALEAERDQLGVEMLKWSQTAQGLRVRVVALTAALRRISYESQLSSWCAFCRGSAHVADAALDAAAGGA